MNVLPMVDNSIQRYRAVISRSDFGSYFFHMAVRVCEQARRNQYTFYVTRTPNTGYLLWIIKYLASSFSLELLQYNANNKQLVVYQYLMVPLPTTY